MQLQIENSSTFELTEGIVFGQTQNLFLAAIIILPLFRYFTGFLRNDLRNDFNKVYQFNFSQYIEYEKKPMIIPKSSRRYLKNYSNAISMEYGTINYDTYFCFNNIQSIQYTQYTYTHANTIFFLNFLTQMCLFHKQNDVKYITSIEYTTQ